MDAPALIETLEDDSLDVLAQPSLAIYTQICLCYAVTNTASHSGIVDTLTKGLERLTMGFPWVAGQVVAEGVDEPSAGVYKLKPLDETPRLVVKDLTKDPAAPTMDALEKAKFPFSMLDESVVAPRNTIPGTSGEALSDEAPVFLVQATFIKGGLLLNFNGQHQAMDMVGQGQVIHLFSKACRNEPFTADELSSGNLPRRDVMPLLDASYKPGSELDLQMVDQNPPQASSTNNTAASQDPPKSSWAYFVFSPNSLSALKSLATESTTSPSGYVSTDDTLTAFIWQSIMRARFPRLDRTTKVRFGRAVDVRRYLDIPATYPGLILNMAYLTYTLQQLLDEPLGGIASNFRAAVDPKTSKLGYNTRAFATVLDRSPDKNIVSVTANLDLSKDLMLSSWAKINCYELDFGLGLGMPAAVRRPQFIPVESLLYLMPRRPDGEVAAAFCLRDEDMDRLKIDAEFTRYATYVG